MNCFTNMSITFSELPVASPLTHGVLRTLNRWQELLKEELAVRGPASLDFIPGCFVESDAKGPAIHKYRSLLEKGNTPFSPIQASAAPTRRLWHHLVRQELVQDIFIRAVFGKKRSATSTADASTVVSVAGDTNAGSGEGLANSTPHYIEIKYIWFLFGKQWPMGMDVIGSNVCQHWSRYALFTRIKNRSLLSA